MGRRAGRPRCCRLWHHRRCCWAGAARGELMPRTVTELRGVARSATDVGGHRRCRYLHASIAPPQLLSIATPTAMATSVATLAAVMAAAMAAVTKRSGSARAVHASPDLLRIGVYISLLCFVRVGDGGGCCSWGGGGAAEPGRVGPRRVFTAAALWSRLRGVGRGRTAVGLRWRARGCERRRRVGVRRPTFGHLPGRRGRQRWPCWGEPALATRRGIQGHLPCHSPPACVGSRGRWRVAGGAGVGGRCGCVLPSGGGAQGDVTCRLSLGRLFWGGFEPSSPGGSPAAGGGRRHNQEQ